MAEARFPAGVRVPITVVVLALITISMICMFGLRAPQVADVARTTIDATQRETGALAGSMTDQIDGASQYLTQVSDELVDSQTNVASVFAALPEQSGWEGVLITDRATGRVVAGRGEPVRSGLAPALGTDAVATIEGGADGGRIVTARGLSRANNGWLVAASRRIVTPIQLRPPGGHAVGTYVVNSEGTVLAGYGADLADLPAAQRDLVLGNALNAGQGVTGSASLELPAEAAAPERAGEPAVALAAYAPITIERQGAQPGLGVLTVSTVTPEPGSSVIGMVFGVSLLVSALIAAAVLHLGVVRPVRRLRRDALAVASGHLDTDVYVSRAREPRRIALALRRCVTALRSEKSVPLERDLVAHGSHDQHISLSPGRGAAVADRCDGGQPRSVPVMAAVVGVGVLLLAWSGALWHVSSCDGTVVPGSALAQSREQSRVAAVGVGQTLLRGRAELEAAAAAPAPAGIEAVLADLAAHQPRYRNVYVVEADGKVSASFGRTPSRTPAPLPAGNGLVQDNTEGPMPIVYAHAALDQPGRAIVAEFDIPFLMQQLGLPPGHGRVVDPEMRTVLASGGFRAFSVVSDDAMRSGVRHAQDDRPLTELTTINGTPSLLSTDAVAAGNLRWTVIVDQPIAEIDMAASPANRRAEVAAILVGFVALLLVSWTYLTTVRPLRRLASTTDNLVAGDIHVVIFPQRHDEIGTITSCFELCRQALTEGAHRLGARTTRRRRDSPATSPDAAASHARHGALAGTTATSTAINGHASARTSRITLTEINGA